MALHSHRAAYALQKLAEDDPTLGALALWCGHRDTDEEERPAAWTAGEIIHYGPAFGALAKHEQVGLAAHHVLHVAFQHGARSRAMRLRFGAHYHGDVYNIASDAIVNETLLQAGYALPRPAMSLSTLMAALPVGQDVREKALNRLDADALYILLLHDLGRRAAGDAERSDESERARLVRAAADEMGFSSDLDEAPEPATDQNGSDTLLDWRQRVATAMEQGRRAGRGIGAVGLRLEDLPTVSTPWEAVLRRLVTTALQDDRVLDYRRPSRRWLALDAAARSVGGDQVAFLPATRQGVALPRIVVGLDSSGSIDRVRLEFFAAQLVAIARRTRSELHMLVFDEAVTSRAVLQGPGIVQQIAAIPFARDGGTSFVDVIDEAISVDPSVVVILTDLHGPFGASVPSCPVIWATPNTDGHGRRQPPFGKVLSLSS